MIKNKGLAVLSISAVILTGCQATVPPSQQARTIYLKSQYNKSQFLELNKAFGNSQVSGSAFLRQAGGGVVSCAGNEVSLVPQTAYSKERISILYGNEAGGYRPAQYETIVLSPTYDSYLSAQRKTLCDVQGKFHFDNVAEGKYYLATSVGWYVGSTIEGGILAKLIEVKDGEDQSVVVTSR